MKPSLTLLRFTCALCHICLVCYLLLEHTTMFEKAGCDRVPISHSARMCPSRSGLGDRSSNHLHASPVNVLNSLRNVIRHSQHEPFYIGSCDSVERRTVSEKDMCKCESCLNFFQYSNNVKESNQIYVF